MTPPGRPLLILLSKPGCHLCDELEEVLQRVLPEFGAALEVRDVRADPDTARRYALDIPVVLLGTEEVVRHRATDAELRARLAKMLGD